MVESAVMQASSNVGWFQPITLDDLTTRLGISTGLETSYIGRDVRVGVIDQGFGMLEHLESANGIQVNLAPGMNRESVNLSTITQGTDALTVIHKIAPGASLYACAYTVFDEYRACIDWMMVIGVHIINHSAGVPALPLDGSNLWAREVDRVARQGTLWVNAAGNFASGYIDDMFTDTNLDGYHEFRGRGIVQGLELNSEGDVEVLVMLSWKSLDGRSPNVVDLDLDIIDQFDEVFATSAMSQHNNSGEEPFEIVRVRMDRPIYIRIRSSQPDIGMVRFALYVEFNVLPTGRAAGSIVAPGDSLNALTVGAMQGSVVAPYSSRGPLVSGAIKPDVVAPGELILPDGRNFVGTSAAAAVVSGITALLWEINPQLSRREMFDFIRDSMTIDDTAIPGPDNTYGFGSLYLQLPDTSIGLPTWIEPQSAEMVPPEETSTFICEGALRPRFEVGMAGMVQNSDSSKVNVRVSAGVDSERLAQLAPLQAFIVVRGPACADAMVWYEVDFGNGSGWISEGIFDDVGQEYYFVEPLGDQRVEDIHMLTDVTCNISIYEDFAVGTQQRWFISAEGPSNVRISNGAYELQILSTSLNRQPITWGSLQEIEFTGDLRLIAEISAQTFSNDDDQTGIWLNYLSADEYTVFAIRSDGHFTIGEYSFGYTPIVNWTYAPAIVTGNNAINVIEVMRYEGTYEFAINGDLVASVPVSAEFSGRIAFFGASYTSPTTFRLDSIRICGE